MVWTGIESPWASATSVASWDGINDRDGLGDAIERGKWVAGGNPNNSCGRGRGRELRTSVPRVEDGNLRRWKGMMQRNEDDAR